MESVCIRRQSCYNRGMKQLTDTTFFDSILGDTFVTYTILNAWTGEPVIENLSHEQVDGFVEYFAWMFGVQESSIIVKKISVSA